MDLSAPLSHWMSAGGDARQDVGPDGMMRYRITPGPRPGVPLGSCTASWPTERSWRDAEVELASWREALDPEAAVAETSQRARRRLRTLFGIGPEAALVLAPSGTDAVLLISALAFRDDRPVHHVVVGAGELGGGTLSASRGLAFSPRSPHGGADEVGRPVPGLAGRCSAETLYLRHDDGSRKEPSEVDDEVLRRVDAAVLSGHHVVLHLVAHSKTGLRSPSVSAASLATVRHPGHVTVLVDAAQGRLSPADVRRARDLGFPVLFTGSKFYGGPPFSGLLVLPDSLGDDPGPLPEGLAAWFARADLPTEWTQARSSLSAPVNPGLALRWVCALSEMEAYHSIEPRDRGRVYHTFAGAVLEVFGSSLFLDVDVPLPPVHRLVTNLGAYPSVFGFHVRDPDSGRVLGADALRVLHALIDTDQGDVDARLAGRYHLGQPVALGPPRDDAPAVLRVALGGRLVTELAGTPDAGAAWLRAQMQGIRVKIECLVASGVVQP